ncbi:hypothetical protein CBL_07615 [Carabus blaptoides fortunei]
MSRWDCVPTDDCSFVRSRSMWELPWDTARNISAESASGRASHLLKNPGISTNQLAITVNDQVIGGSPACVVLIVCKIAIIRYTRLSQNQDPLDIVVQRCGVQSVQNHNTKSQNSFQPRSWHKLRQWGKRKGGFGTHYDLFLPVAVVNYVTERTAVKRDDAHQIPTTDQTFTSFHRHIAGNMAVNQPDAS